MNMTDDSRRKVCKALLASAGLACFPSTLLAATTSSHRSLTLFNLHTGERVKAAFWQQGDYQLEAIASFNHLLRDFRSGEQTSMDIQLLEQLWLLNQTLGREGEIQIISGYRSPTTNAQLRAKSKGVAKNSYHTRGMALDIAMQRVDIRHIHRAAKQLKAGGVGLYTRSNFIHLDTGPVRYW